MDVISHNEFAADPATVFSMFLDPRFLAEVCTASGATRQEVMVTGDSTRTKRVLPAPASAAKFTGPDLTVTEEITWGPSATDGTRRGIIKVAVTGVPAQMNAIVDLKPGGKGTTLDYKGSFRINVPFVGGKLEQQAAPALLEGLQAQQRVGDAYLAV